VVAGIADPGPTALIFTADITDAGYNDYIRCALSSCAMALVQFAMSFAFI
jgi:hypothetical protein